MEASCKLLVLITSNNLDIVAWNFEWMVDHLDEKSISGFLHF